MALDRPLLLVDIDGVLNPYGIDGCPPGYNQHILFPEDYEPVCLAPVHGEWLNELASSSDLVWASAWGFQANELVGPILDLPPIPFVPMPPIPFPPREKVPAIEAYVGDKAFAWVDDVELPEAAAWAAARAAPTLLLLTDPHIGLQRSHVDTLLAWAEALMQPPFP